MRCEGRKMFVRKVVRRESSSGEEVVVNVGRTPGKFDKREAWR